MPRPFVAAAVCTLLLTACDSSTSPSSDLLGPSDKERKRIASRACSEIMGTRNFESSKRASTWNDAVDQIGLDGSYWSSQMSDNYIQITLAAKGPYAAEANCVTSLLQGNPPLMID